MYILSTDGSHSNIGHLGNALDDILDYIGRFVGVYDSVKESCIDINADVVLRIDYLMRHIDYLCL